MNYKKILVTGANGFIGKYFCLNPAPTGFTIQPVVHHKTASFSLQCIEIGHIGPHTQWAPHLKGVEAIVHLAAKVPGEDKRLAAKREAFYETNAMGTAKLAREAVKWGVRRFILLSSAKVHGEGGGKNGSYTERSPLAACSPYGQSKLKAEQFLLDITEGSEMTAIILRPPLVYGPGVKASFLRLMKMVHAGIPLPFRSIQNQRSFIYIENLVNAIWSAVMHPDERNNAYLVSDGHDLSTPELIRHIANALNKPARLFSLPHSLFAAVCLLPGGDAKLAKLTGSFSVNISKIHKEMDWQPLYTVEEGILKTANWFLGRYQTTGLSL